MSGKISSPSNLFAGNYRNMNQSNATVTNPMSVFSQTQKIIAQNENHFRFHSNQTSTATANSSITSVSNSNNNHNQQQQLSSNSEQRLSKEKQKFFRSSAFNSERAIKSPQKPVTSHGNDSSGGGVGGGAWSSVSSPRQPVSAVQHIFNDERDRNYKRVRNKGMSRKKKPRNKYTTPLSSSTSGSSSSNDEDIEEDGDDDDEDDNSSIEDSSSTTSESSSENDDDDEEATYSSSYDSGANQENNKNVFGLLARAAKMPTWASLNNSNNNKNFGYALNGFQSMPATTTTDGESICNNEWGFAAAAKKQNDMFLNRERVFGSKASVNDVQLNTKSQKKESPRKRGERTKNNQLEGLFDGLSQFFQTNDINRQKLKQKKKNKIEEEQPNHQSPPAVLKETRRTFRDYEHSLRRKSFEFPLTPNQYSSNLVKHNRSRDKLPNFAIMSSDDDFSQLSPSKMVKQAISYKKYEKPNSNIFMPSSSSPAPAAHVTSLGTNGGFTNTSAMMDFASLATSSPSFSMSSPNRCGDGGDKSTTTHTGRLISESVPPYNSINAKIGKSSTPLSYLTTR